MADVLRHDEIQGDVIHEYDGIEEADNRLPGWWLATFYLAIVFSLFYWLGYHVFNVLPLTGAEYEAALSQQVGSEVTEQDLLAASQDNEALAKGKALYLQHCAVCHQPNGAGKIGPNLTDKYWLHGGAPLDIYNVIDKGVAAKGMPPWGPILGPPATTKVTAFLLSIRDTNVAGGKEPQGEQ